MDAKVNALGIETGGVCLQIPLFKLPWRNRCVAHALSLVTIHRDNGNDVPDNVTSVAIVANIFNSLFFGELSTVSGKTLERLTLSFESLYILNMYVHI